MSFLNLSCSDQDSTIRLKGKGVLARHVVLKLEPKLADPVRCSLPSPYVHA